MSLNLEKQLCFYGAYHHNPTNITIHMICVPLILAASLLLATNSPTVIPLPSWLSIPNLPLNLGTIAALLYSGFYILLEPVAGTATLPIILGWIAYSNHLTSTVPALANKVALGVEVVSWLAQFVGHGAYEGRAPALLDNLLQAFVLAPFFVWMEFLFKLGYRPELQARVDKEVQKEIKRFKDAKAAKANGSVENGKTK
ncbi:hypothetical protein PVAG01_10692 [Phlyctema vagabunda]|uniref:DUF962 domain-containing protein n=1 Tax=Phlyctema vagabunda TaxID=108571 RepID=A0ABR4P3D1_9HELO